MWNDIKCLIGSARSQFPSQLLIGGKLLSKPLDMAVAMNNFFISKINDRKQNNTAEGSPTDELRKYLNLIPWFVQEEATYIKITF